MVRRAGVMAPLLSTGGKEGNQGTATPVHPEGYLLTAAHVLNGTDPDKIEAVIMLGPRRPSKPMKARLVMVDKDADVALLKVDAKLPAYFEWTPTGATLPKGLQVVHTGLTTAHVSGVGEMTQPLPGGRAGKFGHSLQLKAGDSGGGLVTTSGELVGINSAVGSIVGFGASFFSGSVSSRPNVRRIQNAIARDLARR
jgi:S1-C subfamily serine protease